MLRSLSPFLPINSLLSFSYAQADRKSNSQTVAFYPADLGSFAGAAEALKWAASSADGPSTGISTHLAARPVGRVPDAVICCAGGAKPGWFIEQKEEDFKAGFQTDYMTALSTAHVSKFVWGEEGGDVIGASKDQIACFLDVR